MGQSREVPQGRELNGGTLTSLQLTGVNNNSVAVGSEETFPIIFECSGDRNLICSEGLSRTSVEKVDSGSRFNHITFKPSFQTGICDPLSYT